MNAQDDVLQLVEFFRTLLFNQNCGSYFAAELIRNCHNSRIFRVLPRLFLKSPHTRFRVLR